MWDEAIRVSKFHGGINASKRVAYAWAMDLGGEQGAKLLARLGLVEPAIDYAIESGAFEHAFELAKNCASKKLSEDESAREEIRDWVLTISMDQQVQEKLPERACGQCKAMIYDGTLQCTECKVKSEPCIITGFPVGAKTTVHCTTCKVIADRETWNKWVKQFGNCPWCAAPQKMSY